MDLCLLPVEQTHRLHVHHGFTLPVSGRYYCYLLHCLYITMHRYVSVTCCTHCASTDPCPLPVACNVLHRSTCYLLRALRIYISYLLRAMCIVDLHATCCMQCALRIYICYLLRAMCIADLHLLNAMCIADLLPVACNVHCGSTYVTCCIQCALRIYTCYLLRAICIADLHMLPAMCSADLHL